ncbi:MAG: UDP-3-O-acyl-N-acetylglucosamine deacetylase [Desulfomicrobium sp.]|nr:UDP-3-O-acyl-N-acetylglucosamine deacetylase [Pseudomonadota bacterium]MBV1712266.1 UDP-3-O-acyl-N-acetylglucosamine deacetylase [Desulfomicrobium sp.]MBU4572903.1 UDP-3-O-acyl-N-acetylglucosamine deacetylase [Pseudomonadota bacterium]MBU4594899.1 UDP-3-O-acyl-N-acetylglucosamine deacetylase [Pseudomonadota bacterium]MBV1718462.1 UDP-3-O-acyl-N-acetylglucosamine deacetylase [Desulfomicrobium sp.]
MKQTTLRKEVRCSGVGLHSGQKVEMVLKPAPADTGVVFSLLTKAGRQVVVPEPGRVVGTGLATTLGTERAKVSTVEHLLAALVGLEIDNVLVEVDGEEIPILDGSASVYVYLINSAGIKVLERPREVARVRRTLVFEQDGKRVVAKPYNGLKIDYHINFPHPQIGEQSFCFESTPLAFSNRIARARTFGFMKDVEWLQKNGLALGGSLENAVVFDDYGVINPEGLRYDDEMVRHKILDFMGDIAVGSHRLCGHFEVFCSGHDFNNKFMRYLFDNHMEYLEFVTLGGSVSAPACPDPMHVPAGVPAWA